MQADTLGLGKTLTAPEKAYDFELIHFSLAFTVQPNSCTLKAVVTHLHNSLRHTPA